MIRAIAILLAITVAGCAVFAGSYAVPSAIMIAIPTEPAGGGEGEVSKEARARLEAAEQAARVAATNDAIAAARARPDDVRLLRRAAAMARELPRDAAAELAGLEDVLAELSRHPCPGLADIAATRAALGDANAAGDAYLRAARECASVEAAIAAVVPLRSVERCDEAVGVLRDAWPRIDASRRGAWLEVLDAVAACSDAVTLRRNLSFVPPSVVEDYLAVLGARAAAQRDAERRAEAEAARQAADERARAAAWRCESECSAATSSCSTSCRGDASCLERCDSVGHVCRAGCGDY